MSGFILNPIAVAAGGYSLPTGWDAAFPPSALADVQPKAIVSSGAFAGSSYTCVVDIDLGADMTIDTIAVMFTNLSAAATWRAQGASTASGFAHIDDAGNALFAAMAFGQPPTVPTSRRHGLWTAGTTVRRWVRVIIVETNANPDLRVNIGRVLIGQRWQPGFNFEPGSGRKVDDQSVIRIMPGGETAIERGGLTPLFRCTWSNMTAADLAANWAILRQVGAGSPVLLVEDGGAATGLNEGMHYGVLDSLDFDERTLTDKSTISLRIRELT